MRRSRQPASWRRTRREFLHFVREVVKMPEALAPAVAEAIRQQKWKIAPNPLGTIRHVAAHQEARRMGINS